MAELILSPIAGKILEGLGSAAVKEIALFWGINDDLDQLNETISTIKSVLLDAEEKQINNHQVRNWLHRLGGVVDDADNLMDEFNTEALRRRVMPAGSETVKQNPLRDEHTTSLDKIKACSSSILFKSFGVWIGEVNCSLVSLQNVME